MNSLDLYRAVIRQSEDRGDPVLKLSYPRKLRVPPGYFSPSFIIPAAIGSASFMKDQKPAENPTLASIFVIIQRLIEFKVPTYFADRNLCASLAATEPPEDMALSEIKWPFPAFMIMLPEQFALEYIGRKVLWIGCARIEPGTEIDCRYEFVRGFEIPARETAFCTCAEIIEPNGRIASYYGNMPSSAPVKSFMDTPVKYYEASEERMRAAEKFFGFDSKPMPFDQKTDGEVLRKLTSIIIHLMLLMTARPEMVEEQTVSKQIKGRKEGEKIDLWEPRWIGRGYHPPRPKNGNGNGGTHASPEEHWRAGHWRNQAFGPKHSERRPVWIELTWVGGKEEDEKQESD